MKAHQDIISLLKWSNQNYDCPLYYIAQKWLGNNPIEKDRVIKALERIAEIKRSEIHQYNNFELMKIRGLLINTLSESENFDLSAIEQSLNQTKTFDLLDGIYLSLCVGVCLATGWVF